jgi:transposase
VRVTTLFNRVLGLAATRVIGVRFETGLIVVRVCHRKQLRLCPCGVATRAVYDRRLRRWRHLDVAGTKLMLEAEISRIDCRACGKVVTEQVPWARPNARHSRAFENRVVWAARRMDKSAVAEMMGVAWETVDTMIARAAPDLTEPASLDGLTRIGVDEISYKRGHRYITVVCDHDTGDVVWAHEGKDAATLTKFYDWLGPERCARLEAVSMDLGIAYRQATKRAAPKARICADSFHVLRLVSETIEVVRRKTAVKVKDPNVRWALLKRPENLTVTQRQIIERFAAEETDVWRVWAHCQHLRQVFRSDPIEAANAFDQWVTNANASTIAPLRHLARRLAKHRDMIIATIELRLSNGRLEGTNSKIRLINHRGYGHHRASALIALVLLCCGTPQ